MAGAPYGALEKQVYPSLSPVRLQDLPPARLQLGLEQGVVAGDGPQDVGQAGLGATEAPVFAE